MKQEKEKNPRLGKVGGQAVLEGVMMRSGENVALSVRKLDGTVTTKTSRFVSAKQKHPILGKPIIRGVVSFIESLTMSFSTMSDSVDMLGLEEEEETKFEKWLKEKFGKSALDVLMPLAILLGVALALAIFFFAPTYAGILLGKLFRFGEVGQSISASIVKIIIFIVYMILISMLKDIRRTFEYHGAEHKSIFCYESGEELTVDNVRKQSRFHPRCGTSFMFVMLLLGLIFAVAARLIITYGIGFVIENTLLKTLFYMGISLLILLPLVTGVGYEFLMYAGKHDNAFVRVCSAPGLWMQRITTKEPDDGQMEVAITALKAAMPDEFPPEAPETPTEEAPDATEETNV